MYPRRKPLFPGFLGARSGQRTAFGSHGTFLGGASCEVLQRPGLSAEVWDKKRRSDEISRTFGRKPWQSEEPRFIRFITARPSADRKKKIALIGKGITFVRAACRQTVKVHGNHEARHGRRRRGDRRDELFAQLGLDIEVTGYVRRRTTCRA